MKTRTYRHRIEASLEAVERAVLDAETLEALAARLPEVGEARELERRREGDVVIRVAHFVARLTPPLFGRVCEGGRLEWREEVRWDRRTHRGALRVVPNLVPRRAAVFRCEGTYALVARGVATERTCMIDVSVDLPVMGPTVERLVHAPLAAHFAIEAEVLEERAR